MAACMRATGHACFWTWARTVRGTCCWNRPWRVAEEEDGRAAAAAPSLPSAAAAAAAAAAAGAWSRADGEEVAAAEAAAARRAALCCCTSCSFVVPSTSSSLPYVCTCGGAEAGEREHKRLRWQAGRWVGSGARWRRSKRTARMRVRRRLGGGTQSAHGRQALRPLCTAALSCAGGGERRGKHWHRRARQGRKGEGGHSGWGVFEKERGATDGSCWALWGQVGGGHRAACGAQLGACLPL